MVIVTRNVDLSVGSVLGPLRLPGGRLLQAQPARADPAGLRDRHRRRCARRRGQRRDHHALPGAQPGGHAGRASTSSAASSRTSCDGRRIESDSIPDELPEDRLQDGPRHRPAALAGGAGHRRRGDRGLHDEVVPLGPRHLRDRLQPRGRSACRPAGRPPGLHRVRHQRRAGRPRRCAVPRRVRHGRRHRRHRLRAARRVGGRRRWRRHLRRQRHGRSARRSAPCCST